MPFKIMAWSGAWILPRSIERTIGCLKVAAESGWFAARPSETESIYKIYAESFRGTDHLARIFVEAQNIVNNALKEGKTT